MDLHLEIEKVYAQVRRSDDVSIPMTFDWTITGYSFAGTIIAQTDDVSIGSVTIDTSNIANRIITLRIPSATTSVMTGESYYTYVQWTDTDTKKHTYVKFIWEML